MRQRLNDYIERPALAATYTAMGTRHIVWGALFVISSAIACSSGSSEPPHAADRTAGSISMPLVSQGDVSYRLRNARFAITGAATVNLDSESDPNASDISATLPAGSYSVNLASGWALEKLQDVSYVPVQATLLSANPQVFEIIGGSRTNLGYRFSTDGVMVTIGRGSLDISIEVVPVDAGPCDLLTPVACASESACYQGAAGPECDPIGTGLVGADCDAVNSCVPGAFCFAGVAGNPKRFCFQLCALGATAQCAEGFQCRVSAGLPSGVGSCLFSTTP
jgi:hypothetical protein